LPFCRYGGANGGTIDLEVRTTATSGPIVASSTLAVNSGNVWSTGCTGTYINGTSSTWVLNNNIQWVSGVSLFFTFYPRGTTGTYYFSFVMNGSNGQYYGNGSLISPYLGSYSYNASAIGYALGSTPTNQGQGIYNASTTAALCETFDIGCYLSNAFAWAFYPTIPLSDQLGTLSDTAETKIPFGYVYDIEDLFTDLSDNGTSTLNITIELSPLLNWFGGSFSSTSMTILSATALQSTMGNTMWTFGQNAMKFGLWLGFIFYAWNRARKFL